ncbi:MAG: MBL fold metallo-hydrolase [Myxococcota bacterium]
MKKHLTKLLVAGIAALSIWVAILITPANDFLSLTGIYHLPIPEDSKAHPVDPDKGYYLEELSDGVYFLAGWSHNTMFVETETSVVAIDAPPSIGESYLDAIREVTDKPVSHLIYSHSHDDHIGAANIFGDVTIIAHEITGSILAAHDDPARPVPTVTFNQRYSLEVGGELIELAYHGPAHSPGNIAIHLPRQKVLTMIDIAFPKWTPIHEFAVAEDIGAYFEVYDTLLEYDFDYFIGGHANLGSYQDVADQRQYVLDIKHGATAAYASLDISTLGKRAAKSRNTWVTVNFGLDRMSEMCAEEVEDKWEGKLAGVDVFTHSHCKRMIFHAMTD